MTSGKELLEKPGPLYGLRVLIKVFEGQHYVIGIESDRAVDRKQAVELLQTALEIALDTRAEWTVTHAEELLPVFSKEQSAPANATAQA